ncbi:unnamed protein product [Ectocarpus sp. 13 AM-2016]
MGTMLPCKSVSYHQLVESDGLTVEVARGFHSVVHQAMLTLEASPDMQSGNAGDRWGRAAGKGCLAGSSGVSRVLGLIGSQYVLWSKVCGGLASRYYSPGAVARCRGCREFFREGVLKRLAQAAKPVPHPCTRNKDITSAEKEIAGLAWRTSLGGERSSHRATRVGRGNAVHASSRESLGFGSTTVEKR